MVANMLLFHCLGYSHYSHHLKALDIIVLYVMLSRAGCRYRFHLSLLPNQQSLLFNIVPAKCQKQPRRLILSCVFHFYMFSSNSSYAATQNFVLQYDALLAQPNLVSSTAMGMWRALNLANTAQHPNIPEIVCAVHWLQAGSSDEQCEFCYGCRCGKKSWPLCPFMVTSVSSNNHM